MYKEYKDKGLVVIAFPCNQFGKQDPGTNEEILNFCKTNYGVTFPVMAKVEVNGEDEEALFTFLKTAAGNGTPDPIKWNFTKFLVDRSGTIVKKYDPPVKPKNIKKDIEEFLNK